MATEIPLSKQWHGVNRRIAPHALPETESPDTTDAASSDEVVGILGPRKGRTRRSIADNTIRGIVPVAFPYTAEGGTGRVRIFATDNGSSVTYHPVAVPWPSVITPTAPTIIAGYDVIDLSMIPAITNVSSTTTTEHALGTTFTVTDYFGSVYPILKCGNLTLTRTVGTGSLTGEIFFGTSGGSFSAKLNFSANNAGLISFGPTSTLTGTWNAIRLRLVPGVGVTGSVDLGTSKIYLIKTFTSSVTTVNPA